MQTIRCRAILFDLDGVLVDSTAVVERHWRMWATRHAMDSELILASAHGRRTIDTLRAVASHLDLDLVQEAELLAESESNDTEELVVIPGAAELIRSLPEHSWAVVTSGSHKTASTRLRAAGLPVPRAFVTAEQVSQGKPDPEGYLKAATLLGLEPQDCVVIEDAPAGIQAAHAAGSSVIGVTTTFPQERLESANAIVPTLASIHVTATEHDLTTRPWLILSIT